MSIPNPPYHETINKLLYAILQHFEGNPIPMNVPIPPYYNVTQSLLYEILQKLSGSPVNYLGIRVLYVSSRYGDNATAEINNINKPYKTITAAKNNYFFGDIIRVMEGTYNEGSLSGNYFYFFDFGSQVIFTGASGAIFNQRPGECIVRGYGKFKCTGNASVIDVGNWLNCILDIEAESFESINKTVVLWQNRALGDPTFYKPHRIKAKRAYSSTMSALHYHFNVHAEVEIDEIVSDTLSEYALIGNNIKKAYLKNSRIISSNSTSVMLNANVSPTFIIDNCEIICNYNSVNGHGIILLFWGSDPVIYNTKIIVKHTQGKSIYTDFYCNLYIDNNVSSNRDTGGSFPISYINKERKIILENNEATINITGSTSIDLAAYPNAEVIKVTSLNATEEVNNIISAPKHHSYKILPQGSLKLTLNSTSPVTATDSSIVLENNKAELYGANGDWIELHNNLYGTGNRVVKVSNY